jgi:hypothetical protein
LKLQLRRIAVLWKSLHEHGPEGAAVFSFGLAVAVGATALVTGFGTGCEIVRTMFDSLRNGAHVLYEPLLLSKSLDRLSRKNGCKDERIVEE